MPAGFSVSLVTPPSHAAKTVVMRPWQIIGVASVLTWAALPASAWAAGGPIAFPLWSASPFALLLLTIALGPLVLEHLWHSDWTKALIVALLAGPTAFWMMRYSAEAGAALRHELEQYVSFVVLLFTLYVVAGGIVLRGDLRGTPAVNIAFLSCGAVMANMVGTTGASMVLIRPFLRINHDRKHTAHLPVFFVFIVSNLGGLLTPLGDPPLFLGFLNGVPFGWTLRLWPQWLLANGLTLAMFAVVDWRAWRQESAASLRLESEHIRPLRIRGRINILLMLGVLACVLLHSPRVGAALGQWVGRDLTFAFPWGEICLLILSGLSLALTRRILRAENAFSWGPIREVAIVFAGIFVTMVPALHLLELHGASFGLSRGWHYFWLTGSMSAVLDNAPTYLIFATMAAGSNDIGRLVQDRPDLLAAISCGAVFFGALTYIGNGPNFMVKAIAEQSHYPMPSFLRYSARAALVLIPIFVIVTFVFFRPF